MLLRSFIVVSLVASLLYVFSDRFLVRKELAYNPDRYHGHDHRQGMFFEGWYYNMVVQNAVKTIAVIPGVLINDDQRYAFIMVAYGNISHYYRFPFEGFQSSASSEEFRVELQRKDEFDRIQTNVFSSKGLSVDIDPMHGDDGDQRVRMNLSISSNTRPEDLSAIAPGTMGPFSWFSLMQCYHHVLSLRHEMKGTIQIGDNDAPMEFTGVGYIEKDWGQMFPSTWIWGQANRWVQASTSSASLFFSFANIPIGFGLESPGFLIIFEHNHQFYRFNSYLMSIVEKLTFVPENKTVSFIINDFFLEHRLEVTVHFNDAHGGALLYGPRDGRMQKFVREMLDPDAFMDIRLSKLVPVTTTANSETSLPDQRLKEETLFQGRADHIAFEINGDVPRLCEQFQQLYGSVILTTLLGLRWIILNYQIVLLVIGVLFFLRFARTSLSQKK